MIKPSLINDLSHIGKLRRFRKIAEHALQYYKITDYKLEFIGYSENVTYKITTQSNKYLLRIHRPDNRTISGIEQEFNFLDLLNQHSDNSYQSALKNKTGDYVTQVWDTVSAEPRLCSILSWQEGVIRRGSIADKHLTLLGTYIAKIHNFSDQYKSQLAFDKRVIWNAENLVGENNIFGSFSPLHNVKGFNGKIFHQVRKRVYANIETHIKLNSDKCGMIHADLHFGNILWQQQNLTAIDFDDCGWGSYLYDLAVPSYYMDDEKAIYHKNLIFEAYAKIRPLSQKDIEIIEEFILARHILLQAWLYTRRDHPKLLQYQAKRMVRTMNIFEASL